MVERNYSIFSDALRVNTNVDVPDPQNRTFTTFCHWMRWAIVICFLKAHKSIFFSFLFGRDLLRCSLSIFPSKKTLIEKQQNQHFAFGHHEWRGRSETGEGWGWSFEVHPAPSGTRLRKPPIHHNDVRASRADWEWPSWAMGAVWFLIATIQQPAWVETGRRDGLDEPMAWARCRGHQRHLSGHITWAPFPFSCYLHIVQLFKY